MIGIHVGEKSLWVKGHANRPSGVPPGQNIVCAAVSALTLTMVEGLRHAAREDIKVEQEDGCLKIRWQELHEGGKLLVDTWFLGLLKIQESYGEIEII